MIARAGGRKVSRLAFTEDVQVLVVFGRNPGQKFSMLSGFLAYEIRVDGLGDGSISFQRGRLDETGKQDRLRVGWW